MTVSPSGQEQLETLFCRQDHAAAWLDKPLPAALPDVPLTLSDFVVLFLTLVVIALAVIGVVALSTGQDVNPF